MKVFGFGAPRRKRDYGSPHHIPSGRLHLDFFDTPDGLALVRLLSTLAPNEQFFVFTTNNPTHVVVVVNGVLRLAEILQLEDKPSDSVVNQSLSTRTPRSSLTPDGDIGEFPQRGIRLI